MERQKKTKYTRNKKKKKKSARRGTEKVAACSELLNIPGAIIITLHTTHRIAISLS
jgi:hypothetical protein